MRSSTRSDRVHSDRGQASVEFALVLPVIAIMTFGLVMIGVAVRNELAVELAAREGARAAAVSANPAAAATAAARRAVRLPLDVVTTSDGHTVTVTVTYTDVFDVAVIGSLLGSVTHTASVTMAVEPP